MFKNFLKAAASLIAVIFAVGCNPTSSPEDKEEDDPVVAPVVAMTIGELTRTSVSFTIASDSPGDYAWQILPASEQITDAEALFQSGRTGMFASSNTINLTYNELEGGNEYTLYYAVRKINPYVYSELKSESLSTDFGYEDMITLEKVTPSAISYHIEKPEGAAAYRHMIVDYNDFLYFKALVGVTHESYLSAFGHGDTESKTFKYDWVQMDGWDNYATYFYSDTKYLIIAGKSDSASIDAQVSAEDVEYIEFTTPKAEVCPHKVDIEVSDITSLTAKVTLTPEEGVDRYRAYIMAEADYQAFLFEGEEMLRRAVIGPWDDTSTEYRENMDVTLEGLIPNTRYYVCIVAFDEEMRELYIEESFTTAEPTGPAPEIVISKIEVDEPWNSAAINLKLRNSVSALAFINTKYAVDQVLNAPGNEDLTMDVVIRNNGVSLDANVFNKAISEDGAGLMFAELSPNTEYVYAIMATNQEHVSTSYVYNFKTEAEPVVETTLFGKLKGEYTARITDYDGKPHTFDVTITDGVNDATRESYQAENILVCLGFDPCGVEYHSPEELLKNGWAKTEEEANRNYGPKWFLEIDENDKITTYKHAVASKYFDPVNNVELVDYSAEGEAPMASFDGQTIWFKGTFNRYYASRDKWEMQATTLIHDVDYNEASGTITVKRVKHFKSWSAVGEMITEYPGVSQSKNWYGGSDQKVLFCGNSDLVLTPKASKTQSSLSVVPMNRQIVVPTMQTFDVQKNRRNLRK